MPKKQIPKCRSCGAIELDGKLLGIHEYNPYSLAREGYQFQDQSYLSRDCLIEFFRSAPKFIDRLIESVRYESCPEVPPEIKNLVRTTGCVFEGAKMFLEDGGKGELWFVSQIKGERIGQTYYVPPESALDSIALNAGDNDYFNAPDLTVEQVRQHGRRYM